VSAIAAEPVADELTQRVQLIAQKLDQEPPRARVVGGRRRGARVSVRKVFNTVLVSRKAAEDISPAALDFGIVLSLSHPWWRMFVGWMPLLGGGAGLLLGAAVVLTELATFSENFNLTFGFMLGMAWLGFYFGMRVGHVMQQNADRLTFLDALNLVGQVQPAEQYLTAAAGGDQEGKPLGRSAQRALDERLRVLWEVAERLGLQ
jgi:hypothetical protein